MVAGISDGGLERLTCELHKEHTGTGKILVEETLKSTATTSGDEVSLSARAQEELQGRYKSPERPFDGYWLPDKFKMRDNDYEITDDEKALFDKDGKITLKIGGRYVERTLNDYITVLAAAKAHKFAIATKDYGNNRVALGMLIKPKEIIAVKKEDDAMGTKKPVLIHGRDKTLVEAVLSAANLYSVIKNKDGTYKDPSRIKLNKLHKVDFFKTEGDARVYVHKHYGWGFKWLGTPKKELK